MRTAATFILQVILGGTLVISGLLHLSSPYLFLESVVAYRILPYETVWLIAAVAMHAVLIIGFAIISSTYRPTIYIFSTLMLLVFLAAQTSALMRGLEISCGCFGPSKHSIGWRSLTTTGLLLACSLALWRFDQSAAKPEANQRTPDTQATDLGQTEK